MHFAIAGRREGRHRAPVKAAIDDNHGRLLDVLLIALDASELDGCFVCLCARVGKEDVIHAADRAQPIGQCRLQRDLIEI